MVSFFRPVFAGHSRRGITAVLAFFWCAGLVLGAALAAYTDPFRFYMMRTAATSCVSIFGLSCSLLLPLLLSALAVYISQIWLLIPIAFCKAALFSYWSTAVALVFPASGWLVRFFLLFTDCLGVPALLCLWLRLPDANRTAARRGFAVTLILLGFIGCLDYAYICPYFEILLLH